MLRSLKLETIVAGAGGGIRWLRGKHTVVMSFGDGSQGALGLPTSVVGLGGDAYEPTPVPGLPSDVSSVSAGHYHSLAVTCQGEVWSWGRNNEAQLGRGMNVPRESWHEPRRVEGLGQVKVRGASASGVISTAIGDDGSLWVWGMSKRGQLGLGKGVTEAVSPTKIEALAKEEIVKVSLGWGHVLALTKNGKLFGWGYSADGRLGKMGRPLESSPLDSKCDVSKRTQLSSSIEDAADKLLSEAIEKEKDMPIIWEPSPILELSDLEALDIACGLDHSLILCSDGTLLSSGSNIYGQLGRENQDMGMLPVDISLRPVSIAAGLGHSLAVCQNPEANITNAVSWGWNRSNQLGRQGPEPIPKEVEELAEETLISVSGGRAHSIALTSGKQVWAWGSGRSGRLGLGSSIDAAEPELVECLEDYEM